MTISEYIGFLQAIRDEHGELSVEKYAFDGSRIVAGFPEVAYGSILQGRERKNRFWSSHEGPERKGEKVVRV